MNEELLRDIEVHINEWFSFVEQSRNKYKETKASIWAGIVLDPTTNKKMRYAPTIGYISGVTNYPQTAGVVNRANCFACLNEIGQYGSEIFNTPGIVNFPEELSIEELGQELIERGYNAQVRHHDIIVTE